jgi:hypothetical protein
LFPQVQNRRAAAALHITTLSSTSIISNRNSSLINMTTFIRKSKVVLLKHMKPIPDVPAADDEDYIIWGKHFVEIAVSRKLIRGGCN